MALPAFARRSLGAATVLALGGLAGCYNYVPVTSPTPGTTVRVHVPVHSAIPGQADIPSSVSVEGRLLRAGDTLEVETESTREAGTFRQLMLLDTLRIARSDAQEVDLKQFSNGRTAVFTAAILGAAVGVGLAVANIKSGSQGSGPGTGKPTGAVIFRLPIFRSGILGFPGG